MEVYQSEEEEMPITQSVMIRHQSLMNDILEHNANEKFGFLGASHQSDEENFEDFS